MDILISVLFGVFFLGAIVMAVKSSQDAIEYYSQDYIDLLKLHDLYE